MSKYEMCLYTEIRIKYLQGLAIIEVGAIDGKFEAYSAVTPGFGIDYGDSAQAANPSAIEGGQYLPKSVGSGMGFDFGVSVVIGKKLKLGLAINDIGSITWDGIVYQVDDDSLCDLTSSGFGSYNILVEVKMLVGE